MKSVFLILFLSKILFAGFASVYINSIDAHYKKSLSQEKLRHILSEIEHTFEAELGFNVFDYADDGKPIDIIYMPPSKKKKKLLLYMKRSKSLNDKLTKKQPQIEKERAKFNASQKLLNAKYDKLNISIEVFNAHVSSVNKNVNKLTSAQYNKEQSKILKQKKKLDLEKKHLKSQTKILNKNLRNFKRKVRSYNLVIKKYNKSQRDIERLSKNIVEIKGMTKGTKVLSTEKDTQVTMEKIEIYSFENLQQLKVILAHEIGHLVGVEHLDKKGALMHPLLQDAQIKKLSLTPSDIQAFQKAFNKL